MRHGICSIRNAALGKEQILINSSRGPVVDNKALKSALQSGAIKAAVLDVWEGEPDLDPGLIDLLDITTPHIAGYSADGKANGTMASVRTVAEILGLPLTEWTPSGVPAPEQALSFVIDAEGKSCADVLKEAVLHTYDVREDSDRLRNAPELFEKLRGDYQIRREPSAFSIELRSGTVKEVEALEAIGFKVINK